MSECWWWLAESGHCFFNCLNLTWVEQSQRGAPPGPLVAAPAHPRPSSSTGFGGAAPAPTTAQSGAVLSFSEADPSIVVPVAAGPQLTLIELDPNFVFELLVAKTPRALEDLFPPFLVHLRDHPLLGTALPEWSAEARLVRALRAGVSARRVLDEEFDKQARSLKLPVNSSIYVVLRCNLYPAGFYTWSYTAYIDLVGSGSGLEPGSVSHGFPTLAEAEAFLRGARLQWPQQLQLEGLL